MFLRRAVARLNGHCVDQANDTLAFVRGRPGSSVTSAPHKHFSVRMFRGGLWENGIENKQTLCSASLSLLAHGAIGHHKDNLAKSPSDCFNLCCCFFKSLTMLVQWIVLKDATY